MRDKSPKSMYKGNNNIGLRKLKGGRRKKKRTNSSKENKIKRSILKKYTTKISQPSIMKKL